MTATDAWGAWVPDPLALGVAGALVIVLRARRPGPSTRGRDRSLVAGAVVLVLALVSPVAGLSADLVSAHMVQHLLLVVVAGPLLAAGDPGPALLASLPAPVRRSAVGAWRALPPTARRPGAAVVGGGLASALAMWAWHVPALHVAAVEHPVVHLFEHATLLVPAVVYWGGVLHRRSRHRHLLPAIVLTSAVMVMLGGVLGALLTFVPQPLYPVYVPNGWGLSPLQDQQFAGALLWVAGGPAYTLAAAVAIVRAIDSGQDLAPVDRGRR